MHSESLCELLLREAGRLGNHPKNARMMRLKSKWQKLFRKPRSSVSAYLRNQKGGILSADGTSFFHNPFCHINNS
jgi:hypothetical protein